MPEKSKEKLIEIKCIFMRESLKLWSGKCLEIAYYGFKMLVWFHNQKIFEIDKAPRVYGYLLIDKRSENHPEKIPMKYALGGLYYDFVKGLEEFGVYLNE